MAAIVDCQEKTSGDAYCLNKNRRNSLLTGESIDNIENEIKVGEKRVF